MVSQKKINQTNNTLNNPGHLESLYIFDCYKKSRYLSIKHSSYFQVYSELFEPYRGKPITFVEIGVLNGGSLFMWREFFGSEARIIGLDFNPGAAKWKESGFEILIGSQSDKSFWNKLFDEIGPIDILLDDGGHTYEQQIITVDECVPFIRDGGLIVVEDAHTSYFKDFGYPSKYSFMEWAKFLVDEINGRFPSARKPKKQHHNNIFSITFYESIVSFKIDRAKCFSPQPTTNNGISEDAQDFRYVDSSISGKAMSRRFFETYPWARKVPGFKALIKLVLKPYIKFKTSASLRKLAQYF